MPVTLADLDYYKAYFLDRCGELLHLAGTVWPFVGAACIIDYLTKLVNHGESTRTTYIQFIKDYMPRYRDFEYVNSHDLMKNWTSSGKTKSDLPEQMYVVLRCGLVHQFSMIPDQQGLSNGGRDRSIVMIHRAEADQPHLSNYSNAAAGIPDACHFVVEDFIEDLMATVRAIFHNSTNHASIIACLNAQPPIGVVRS